MGITSRSFSAGHFLLELDGVSAGYVKNLQGGGAVADVIREKAGADFIVHKHVGPVRFEDIVLTCGGGLSKAFYDWVAQTSAKPGARHDGALVVYDGSKEISRLNWSGGLITKIVFPALDAASKDSFSMTIKITPESTRSGKGTGGQAVVAKAQKNWLASNFRLTIGGLEDACKRVSRIEPITLAWKTVKDQVGEMRDYTVEPGPADPGHLIVTLAESHAKGFYDWFEDFVIKGNSGPDKEKEGTLESGPFSLTLGHLGIFGVTRPSSGRGAMIRKITVEMYCESIQFSASSAAASL